MSLDLLGAECIGDDNGGGGILSFITPVLQTAGEAAKAGIAYKEGKDAAERASTNEKASIEAATGADRAAVTAIAKAEVSALTKSASAAIDKDAAEDMVRRQDRAASALSESGQRQRAAAAEDALSKAITAAQASPKDQFKLALMKAWRMTVNKAQSGAIASSASPSTPASGGDSSVGVMAWLSRPAIGPVPNWGLAAGGVGIVALLAKKFLGAK